jgi:hypothetical protein
LLLGGRCSKYKLPKLFVGPHFGFGLSNVCFVCFAEGCNVQLLQIYIYIYISFFPRFCYSLFHFFFFSLFSSSLHFQFYNALFQLHNALSFSFFGGVIHSSPNYCVYCFFLFQFCCCSFLCWVIICSSSMLLQFSCFSLHSFFSTFNFQLHSALFQLHNALSCSFLALLFIPLQTTLLLLFVPFSILVVVHSCAELLFVPLQCCYNSLLFSTISCIYSTILLLTIILFTLFQLCVVVPSSYVALLLLQHCCSLLST